MKKLELQNFDGLEMDAKEMREIGGGSLWGLIRAAVNVVSSVAETVYDTGKRVGKATYAFYDGQASIRPSEYR